MHPSGPVPAVELTAHTRCRSTNEAVARSPSVLPSYFASAHRRCKCFTHISRERIDMLHSISGTSAPRVCRRTSKDTPRARYSEDPFMRVQARYSERGPLIRTQARYLECGRPRPRTEQTAHVRNRKPTRVVSEVEDCEKLAAGRVSRSGYQHASG